MTGWLTKRELAGAHSFPLSPSTPEITDRLDRIERRLEALAGDPDLARLEPWLSKKQLAQALGVSAKWVQERVNDGMPHRTIAQGHKFRLSVVEPWLKARGYLREVA